MKFPKAVRRILAFIFLTFFCLRPEATFGRQSTHTIYELPQSPVVTNHRNIIPPLPQQVELPPGEARLVATKPDEGGGEGESSDRECPHFPESLLACRQVASTHWTASTSPLYTVFPTAPLPPDVPMNKDAGLGNWIIINIHLAGGEDFPVVLDTGCPTTCLDTSFEPQLGQRITTNTLWDFGVKSEINVFLAPKFFLDDTPLAKIGPYVVTHNCKQISSAFGHPVMGILGMDILQNYCVQLDFAARKIRFLDYDRANKSRWGAPLPLFEVGDGCVAINGNLAGAGAPGSLIDTGYNQDGWLVPKLFEQWTNQAAPLLKDRVHSPNGALGPETYPALNLRGVDPQLFAGGDAHIKLNGIGLRFLARHLVTLDFPEQTLYLKRVINGPPADKELQAQRKSEEKSAAKFLRNLESNGKLPGWAKTDSVAGGHVMIHDVDLYTATFDIPKNGEPYIYHYTVSRDSDSARWQLQRAWKTDLKGSVVEEYSLP